MAMVHLKPLDATNQIFHCLEKFWMFIFPVYVVLQCKQTFFYYAEIFLNRANLNALVSFDLDDTIMSTNTVASCCWRRRQCLSKKYLLYTTKYALHCAKSIYSRKYQVIIFPFNFIIAWTLHSMCVDVVCIYHMLWQCHSEIRSSRKETTQTIKYIIMRCHWETDDGDGDNQTTLSTIWHTFVVL